MSLSNNEHRMESNDQQEPERAAKLKPRGLAKWYFLENNGVWKEINLNCPSLYHRLENAYATAYEIDADSRAAIVQHKWSAKVTYEFDVQSMTQTNLQSGKVRSIRREGSIRAALTTRSCMESSGSGKAEQRSYHLF